MAIHKINKNTFLKNTNYLILLIFIISCASFVKITEKVPKSAQYRNANEDFYPYINLFHEVLGSDYVPLLNDGVSIRFSAMMDPDTAGICRSSKKRDFSKNEKLSIKINYKKWNNYPKESREALMLHELGHCLCGLKHINLMGKYKSTSEESKFIKSNAKYLFLNGYFEDKCPTSIMHPTLLSDSCYKKYKQIYQFEIKYRCIAMLRTHKKELK